MVIKDFKILLVYPNEPMMGVVSQNLPILAACVKQAGFDVKLFDCTFYPKIKIAETNEVMHKQLLTLIK